jgi:hypothetical protein
MATSTYQFVAMAARHSILNFINLPAQLAADKED